MGFMDNILDWAADKVQTVTGEKERRQLVQELKDKYIEFKDKLIEKISILNTVIKEYNDKIRNLNTIREQKVRTNIEKLHKFLGKFGNAKGSDEYSAEKEKQMESIPEKQFEKMEEYISDVDWSKDDVFVNTFFLSPIGMKMKTRKQNLSMRENINQLQIESEEMLNQLKMKTFIFEQDKQICDLYVECVESISNYITKSILPELELVEAFFQAQKIKNEILSNQPLFKLEFKNNIDLLQNTIYEKHYLFVKNTFMFYVISCKIYNTPVLTNLLNNKASEEDVKLLEKQKEILLYQKNEVNNNLMMNRGS